MSKALFEYQLRESPRARRVRLRVTLEHGLEVIVPAGYKKLNQIHRFMEQKQRWIHAALQRTEANRKFSDPRTPWSIPVQISLPAVAKVWEVKASVTRAAGVSLRAVSAGCVEMRGHINDEKACRAALSRWLVRQAQGYLGPRLRALSEHTGMHH